MKEKHTMNKMNKNHPDEKQDKALIKKMMKTELASSMSATKKSKKPMAAKAKTKKGY
tara:strand:- start:3054 stop:3224 length:171 start_codon:yes stop_codon:yes gene_type:complete